MKGLLTLLMLAGIYAAVYYLPGKARHHCCETGVVYTTDYLTLRVPGGVVGFPPGTRFVERFNVHIPDREVISDGKYMLAVDPFTLTHDIEYAQELAESDQLGQDQDAANIAQGKARTDANRHAAELVAAGDIDGMNASLASSSAVGNYDSLLRRPTTLAGVAGYGSYGGSGGGTLNGSTTAGNYYNNVTVNYNSPSSPRSASWPVNKPVPDKVAVSPRMVSGPGAPP